MSKKIIAALRAAPPWLQPFVGLIMLVLIAASAPIWVPLIVGYCFYREITGDYR